MSSFLSYPYVFKAALHIVLLGLLVHAVKV